MNRSKHHPVTRMLMCGLLLVTAAAPGAAGAAAEVEIQRAVPRLPLYFIPNLGQLELPASYYVQGRGGTALFNPDGVTFALAPSERSSDGTPRGGFGRTGRGLRLNRPGSPDLLTLEFVGSNRVEPVGEDPSQAVYSWFRGTGEQSKTGLPMYASIRYVELWPGIDLVYSGDGGRLKYTFEVKPGAHPGRIRLAYTGDNTTVARDDDDGLSISTSVGIMHEPTPYVFQEINGTRVEVSTSYEIDEGRPGEYGFDVDSYDRTRPLIIDPPSFVYAGFLGGIALDRGLGIDVDSSGNAYFTGQVSTPGFFGFDFDAYVAKINPAGTALVYYSVFSGFLEDEAFDIVVDSAGNAYFTGASRSADYPVMLGPDTSHNGGWDVIVTKLAPEGTSLVFSGFLGGTGTDAGEGIAIDGAGNVFVEGPTSSDQHSFPVKTGPDRSYNGNNDIFVAKIKAVPDANSVRRNLHYCGYIGGNDDDTIGSGTSSGHLAIDSAGAAYIGGSTRSTESSFPDGRGFGSVPGFDQTHNGDLTPSS